MTGCEVYENHVDMDFLFRIAVNQLVHEHHKVDVSGLVKLFNDPNLLAKFIVESYVKGKL